MSLLLLDTSILIDVLRGHEPAVELLGSLDAVPACSEITRAQELEAELSTLNVRHFPMFEELEPPYRPAFRGGS